MCAYVLRNIYIYIKNPQYVLISISFLTLQSSSHLSSQLPLHVGFPVLLQTFSSGASFPLEGHLCLIGWEKLPPPFQAPHRKEFSLLQLFVHIFLKHISDLTPMLAFPVAQW